MTKKNFLFLVLTTAGGLLFALGMCMCLLPEWNAFGPGVAVTALGATMLIAISLVRWIMAGRPVAKINWRKTGRIIYCVAAALVLGLGMSMIMAFDGLMVLGILVGIAGIVMGVCAIPMWTGWKE